MSEITENESVPILELNDVAISYMTRKGAIEAASGISFKVHQGETVGLVGESGCGKSTVAFGIVNFLGTNGRVTAGSIKFQGEELVDCSDARLQSIRGNRISMVFQDPMQALNPSLCIGEQLSEVLTCHQKLEKADAWERSVKMLERVYMPDPVKVMDRYPHQLSGGQQQRVVIAMAMLNHPTLLIMDEPTTALDVTVEAVVLDLIEDLKKEYNTGIVYISHNLGVITRVSSRLCVMYAGELVEQGSVKDVFANPIHPYTQGLLKCVPTLKESKGASRLYHIRGRVPAPDQRLETACTFAPRCDCQKEECLTHQPELTTISPGHLVRCSHRGDIFALQTDENSKAEVKTDGEKQQVPDKVLITDQMKVYYEQKARTIAGYFGLGRKEYVKAIDGVSLGIRDGMTLGVVGESGCGKSTLVKGIIGLETITEGKAEFMGYDITIPVAARKKSLIKEIQMVFQNPDSTLNPTFSVGRQIARPIKLFNTLPSNEVRSEVERLLNAVRLDATYYYRLPRQLSGGEKQRVGIARALASRPDLVICDEPVSSLDVSVQAAVLNLLMELQEDLGTTMIFIAHDLSVVRYFSDYIAVMYLGNVVEFGPNETIYEPPYHPYTEALLAAVPIPDPMIRQKKIRLSGEVPSALHPPTGCHFHTRCPRRDLLPDNGAVCVSETPPWRNISEEHRIMCHLSTEELSKMESVLTDSYQDERSG
jgi:peptide/nickel transport system ATP-binding protein